MEAGKKRLAGDIVRQANTGEVTELRREARDHPVGGAIAPSGQANTGHAECSAYHFLPLVRALPS